MNNDRNKTAGEDATATRRRSEQGETGEQQNLLDDDSDELEMDESGTASRSDTGAGE